MHPDGERPADESSHARPGGDIDRDAVLFQPPDHTDVRDTAGAATTEGDADSRLKTAGDWRRQWRPFTYWRTCGRTLQGRGAGSAHESDESGQSHDNARRAHEGGLLRATAVPYRRVCSPLFLSRGHDMP